MPYIRRMLINNTGLFTGLYTVQISMLKQVQIPKATLQGLIEQVLLRPFLPNIYMWLNTPAEKRDQMSYDASRHNKYTHNYIYIFIIRRNISFQYVLP